MGRTDYIYDVLNRLNRVQDPRGFILQYLYDPSGLVTRMTYPGNRSVNYAYNAVGQLESLTDWLGNVTRYSYDGAGHLTGMRYPNGHQSSYNYDAASRLVGLINRKPDNSVLSSYQFTLDALGRRTQVEKEEPLLPFISAEDSASAYNNENALTNRANDNYSYDANGNLARKTEAAGLSTYNFNEKNQLSSILSPAGQIDFTYDGDGDRVLMARGNQHTQFVIDPNHVLGNVVAEANAGNIQNYYVYGLGLAAKVAADGSQIRYYHYDPLGSTVALSDPQGNVTDTYLYDEFGGLNRSTGNTPNPFQYVGRLGVQNDGTGLYHMRARYYDPVAGRFISRDPIGLVGGMNLYGYVENNPVSYVDPSGQIFETGWDILNIGLGVYSLQDNIQKGDWGWAALDVLGLVYDVGATFVPFLPAGVSAGVKALRAGNTVVDSVNVGSDVIHIADNAHYFSKAADVTTNAAQEGTKIHKQVADAIDGSLSSSAQNSFRGSNGAGGLAPDMTWGNARGVWADLTTPNQWKAHEKLYSNGPSTFGEGIPLLYERGKGLVNTPRLYSGAGTVFTGTQQSFEAIESLTTTPSLSGEAVRSGK
ncbi:MAG TPA: hypothetical protein DDW49_00310 [Deltaproteobacteria bacterium]|nr:hypothetical protein [Deltaproteobacteria bacterium]